MPVFAQQEFAMIGLEKGTTNVDADLGLPDAAKIADTIQHRRSRSEGRTHVVLA